MLTRFFESRLFQGLEKIIDALIMGLYFLICCLPIFTIGASFTALYYSIHKVIYQGRGYTTEFWHSFKDNFKQSTLSWLIFLGIGGLLAGDYYIVTNMLEEGDKMANLQYVFIGFMAILIIWAVYHFTYIARFEMGFKQSFKVSGALAVLHFAYSILILAITVVFGLFCYLMAPLIFLVPSLYIVCIHPIMEKVYRGAMSEEDLAIENERLGKFDNKED